jgi:chaperone required for assembly of F1-ATPase
MLSTNVNQYLAFQTLQRTWRVHEWGAQVRKYKNIEKPPLEEAMIQQKDP